MIFINLGVRFEIIDMRYEIGDRRQEGLGVSSFGKGVLCGIFVPESQALGTFSILENFQQLHICFIRII